MTLHPGDVLLYRPTGIFGWVIATKTWHQVGHCEIYLGAGVSVASRDGLGVGIYPLRTADLATVCREAPRTCAYGGETHTFPLRFDLAKALAWYRIQPAQPYGWLDLLQFVGLNIDSKGIVCSPFATEFLRAGGLDPFNHEPSLKIAPFQFRLSPVFDVTEVPNGVELDAVVVAPA